MSAVNATGREACQRPMRDDSKWPRVTIHHSFLVLALARPRDAVRVELVEQRTPRDAQELGGCGLGAPLLEGVDDAITLGSHELGFEVLSPIAARFEARVDRTGALRRSVGTAEHARR